MAKTSKNDEQKEEDDQKEKTHMDRVLEDMTKKSEKILNDDSAAAASFSALFSRLTTSLDDDAATSTEEGAAAAAENDQEEDMAGASSMMMEPILTMLFSKDILYPSLKLMLDNYDKYIDERKDKLTDEEMAKCREQKTCISEMCNVYESMRDDDTKEAKSESLKKILDLLEKCGVRVFCLVKLLIQQQKCALITWLLYVLDAA